MAWMNRLIRPCHVRSDLEPGAFDFGGKYRLQRGTGLAHGQHETLCPIEVFELVLIGPSLG